MNCQRLIFLVVVTLAIVCRAETNSFGIYLTAEPVEPRVLHGEGNWSRVRLSKTPVISGSDIISYNFAEHSMRLRAEALARIPQPSVHGTPFVVVVNEERKEFGTRWIVPYLALRNVRDLAHPLEVRCDRQHVQFELVDAAGNVVTNRSVTDRSGPVPDLGSIILPLNSSIHISMECRNW